MAAPANKDRLVLNPILVHRQEGETMVFFHYDTRCLFRMPLFAGSLLLRCDGNTSVAELVRWASKEYGLPVGRAEELVREFLKKSMSEGLLRIVPR